MNQKFKLFSLFVLSILAVIISTSGLACAADKHLGIEEDVVMTLNNPEATQRALSILRSGNRIWGISQMDLIEACILKYA